MNVMNFIFLFAKDILYINIIKMVTNQNHLSNISNKQEVIRHIKKLAQIFRLNKQNAEVYNALSSENRTLKKQLEDYHSQHNTLERRIKKLEKNVKSLETELEDLDEYINKKTVIDLIHEIAFLSNIKKWLKGTMHKSSSYSFESSEESDSVETFVVRE